MADPISVFMGLAEAMRSLSAVDEKIFTIIERQNNDRGLVANFNDLHLRISRIINCVQVITEQISLGAGNRSQLPLHNLVEVTALMMEASREIETYTSTLHHRKKSIALFVERQKVKNLKHLLERCQSELDNWLTLLCVK
jgi:hypothetical protein